MNYRHDEQNTYDRLLQMITSLDLEPGALVSEGDLSRRLDVDRSEIRDAVGRLAVLDLVSIVPRAGVLISPLSFLSIQQLNEARYCLEPSIARLAAQRINDDQVNELISLDSDVEHLIDSSDGFPSLEGAVKHIDLDRKIHTTLANISQNSFLERALQPLLIYNARIWNDFFRRMEPQGDNSCFISHADLLSAVAEGKPRLAENAMRTHLETCWEMLANTFSSEPFKLLRTRVDEE
jgi:DNA-binding GntR family transcriptional regulator